jgi:hypothetical protein
MSIFNTSTTQHVSAYLVVKYVNNIYLSMYLPTYLSVCLSVYLTNYGSTALCSALAAFSVS